ncbi:HAD family hydrolase [Luteimicrobium sp. NPDC057192]|uniref:HAD family hydrolase n=1 Tax=Luteimicrobium sp. NPDC057192 TaxID=3346042 RepID=UPI0036317F3A
MNHPAVLLLDFDGTVCVGDGPVRAYADAVVTAVLDAATTDTATTDIHGAAGRSFSEDLREGLEAYLDSAAATEAQADGQVPVDGYAAVAALAARHATPAQLDAAYTASREALATSGLEVAAPAGLVALLEELGPQVERVLVTNAPARGVTETLARLGLADVLDDVVTEAAKPAGWDRILPAYLAGRPPQAVLAVGDVWRNDVEPPLAAGCATALIDRFGHRPGPAHAAARTFEELYPAIREWAADPAGFVARHEPVVHGLAPVS